MELVQLTASVYCHCGATNTGIILGDDRKAILIDCGTEAVEAARLELGVKEIEAVLFTHHHRDHLTGLEMARSLGARLIVPASEAALIARADEYWGDPDSRWRLFDFRPHMLVPNLPFPVDVTTRGGDEITLGGQTIRVIDTPGHTEGSISYAVEDADVLIVFVGDTVYSGSEVLELYSLQRRTVRQDYHGYMGDIDRLVRSIETIEGLQADAVVPTHGTIERAPARFDLVIGRLRDAYANFASISALNHYFPALLEPIRDQTEFMTASSLEPAPPFLDHIGTTWIITSSTGASLLIDCGSERVAARVCQRAADETSQTIDALWLSHYHTDHVDGLKSLLNINPVPIWAQESVADVVEHPEAYRLPCQAADAVHVNRRLADRETWHWHEFTLTSFEFPGQTLHHAALLVEGRNARLFFIGDAFTPTGIDDYCMYNRNLLGSDVGYRRCLNIIRDAQPVLLFNCHVDGGFRFTDDQIHYMEERLIEREQLLKRLLPWSNPNVGIDPYWTRCDPFEQSVELEQAMDAGINVSIHIEGYVDDVCTATAIPKLPNGWAVAEGDSEAMLHRGRRSTLVFKLQPPYSAHPGRWVIPFSIKLGKQLFPVHTETVIELVE